MFSFLSTNLTWPEDSKQTQREGSFIGEGISGEDLWSKQYARNLSHLDPNPSMWNCFLVADGET